MRVRILGRTAGPGGNFAPGTQVIEVDEATALKMVVSRQAIYTLAPATAMGKKEEASHDDKD